MGKDNWDALILGAGVAGMTAGLYAARAGRRALILERGVPGGQAALPARIDNYPGLPGVDGGSLAERLREQTVRAGAELICTRVNGAYPEEKRVETDAGIFYGRTLVIATGAEPKELGIPGEQRLRGRGVSYCATCDSFFYRGEEIYVVGGGGSAGEEALHLARLGKHVTVLIRGEQMRCEDAVLRELEENPKITLEYHCALREIFGQNAVEALRLEDTRTGTCRTVSAPGAGIFVFIGYRPATALFQGRLPMDEAGYLLTDSDMHTALPGVFAAGDVRQKSLRQIVTAAADGAIAAAQACKFLRDGL